MCQVTTRSEEHTSELQSHLNLVCRLLLEKKYNHPLLLFPPVTMMRASMCHGLRTRPQACVARHECSEPYSASSTLQGRCFFFFNNPATPDISPLPLPAPLPI